MVTLCVLCGRRRLSFRYNTLTRPISNPGRNRNTYRRQLGARPGAHHQHGSKASFDFARAWFSKGLSQASASGAAIRSIAAAANLLAAADPAQGPHAKGPVDGRQILMEQIRGFNPNWSIIHPAYPSWARAVR